MLTVKQQKFVDAYTGNATKAAIAAGYSTPEIAGHRCLQNAKIRKEIKHRQKKENKPEIMSRQERQKMWTDIAKDTDLSVRDRLRASELLGKSEMDFTEKIQHSGDVEISISWAGCST